jgi:hydroxymethylbilane synthase
MHLRVGTRGSDLALCQTREVCTRLSAIRPDVSCSEVVIRTHGDDMTGPLRGGPGEIGFFSSALEDALLANEVDFVVHSHKDLPTVETPGLVIAAIPLRAAPQDVALLRLVERIADLPPGARIGTSSPRRAAQWRRQGAFVIAPLRGNVPTRVERLHSEELDAIVIAAAGLDRLGLRLPRRVDLPVERFVPAPAQGALAVQARADSSVASLLASIDDAAVRRTVAAERSFLRTVGPGCHTPVGALATLDGERIELRGQIFTPDGNRVAEGVEIGLDPRDLGARLADRLMRQLD